MNVHQFGNISNIHIERTSTAVGIKKWENANLNLAYTCIGVVHDVPYVSILPCWGLEGVLGLAFFLMSNNWRCFIFSRKEKSLSTHSISRSLQFFRTGLKVSFISFLGLV